MSSGSSIIIGLNAVILRVTGKKLQVLTVQSDEGVELPFGPFLPETHPTMESGLRSWVTKLTGMNLGYVEQLYTFGNRGRYRSKEHPESQVVSVGYLALTKGREELLGWSDCYSHLPWEDWRNGIPHSINNAIYPHITDKQRCSSNKELAQEGERSVRSFDERVTMYFGDSNNSPWDEQAALERYELMYESGLVYEAQRDQQSVVANNIANDKSVSQRLNDVPMRADHRRILATALGRLRGKIQYRPVVFELLPKQFTLTQIQTMTEAILGRNVHGQNFRRMMNRSGWITPTDNKMDTTGGRPAKLYKFSRSNASASRM